MRSIFTISCRSAEKIEYVLSTKRFEEPLFQWKQEIFKQGYESVNSVFIAAVTCIICRFLILFS